MYPSPQSGPKLSPRSSKLRQRGATAVFAAGVLGLLIPLIALLVDVGQLYYTQRQLEKLASVAALDAARVGSGCARDLTSGNVGSGIQRTLAQVSSEVDASIARNNITGLTLVTASTPSRVELGRMDTSGGRRIFVADTSKPNLVDAVRVTLAATQPTPFFPFLTSVAGNTLYASASVQQAALGSFYLGTTVANLSGGLVNQLLGGLLCLPGDTVCQNNIIGLNLLSSTSGLALVNISLGQLATAAGVGVKDLSDPVKLNATAPLLKNLLSGLSTTLSGSVSSTVTTLLQNLATASTNPNAVPLGRVLGTVDAVAGAVPFVNLLDLILALGQAANEDPSGAVSPIKLPVNLDIPGVATVSSFVRILDAPTFSGLTRPGGTAATSSQVAILVRIAAGQLLVTLKNTLESVINLALGLVGAITNINSSVTVVPNLNIGVDVAVAKASATLDSISCPVGTANGGKPVAGLTATPSIASVAVGTFSGAASAAPALSPTGTLPLVNISIDATCALKLLGICTLNLGSATVTSSLGLTSVGVGGGTPVKLLDITDFQKITTDLNTAAPLPAGTPPYYLADGAPKSSVATSAKNPQTVGSPVNVGISLKLNTTTGGSGLVGVLSGLVATLVSTISNLLTSLLALVNGLATSLINPLLQALGLQLGSVTVTMDAVQVSQPLLFTTCVPGDTSAKCAVGP